MATNPRHVKLSKNLFDAFATRLDNLDRQIENQKTSKSGSMFIRSGEENEDGSPKGTGTLIGAGATSGGIAPWVNDTTPPGRPTGAVASSGNGMILLRWDGTLEGGIPDDFDHISWFVDGVERGRLMAKGVSVVGPLDVGSVHTVYAVAYDNAHDQNGNSTPNASNPTPTVSVTVSGADIDPDVLGITVTKTDKDPDTPGKHTGDLWLRYDRETEGRNVLHNPGFETGDLSNWACNWIGLGNVKTDKPHSGRYSFTGTPRANSWSEMSSNETITVHDGDTVVMRAWVSQYNLTRPGFYLTYRPTETGIAYTPAEAYCNITNGNSTFAQYEKRYTYHGSGTQHWKLLLTTLQDATDGRYLNMDDFEYCIMSKSALAASWWWNGTSWVQLPIAMYLDQLAVRNVQVDEAVIGMLSTGIVQSATFTTPDGLTGFNTDGFWVKNPDESYAFLANKDGIMVTGKLQTASVGSRIEIAQTDTHNMHNGYVAGFDNNGNMRWSINSNTYDDGSMNMFIGSTLAQNGQGKAPEVQISSSMNPNDTSRDSLILSSSRLEISSHDSSGYNGPILFNGNIGFNGMPLYSASRRVFDWNSDWGGTVNYGTKDGTKFKEVQQNIHVDGHGERGQWFQCDLGCRVATSGGEYCVQIEVWGGDGNCYGRTTLLTTRGTSGVDNFSTSKMMYIPNGDYAVVVYTAKWGDVRVDSNVTFGFTDYLTSRGIRNFVRYAFLTEM